MKKRLIIAIGLVFVLTAVSFAAATASTTPTISSTAGVTVTAAVNSGGTAGTDAGKFGDNPSWSPMANTTGSVSNSGDLYVVTVPAQSDSNKVHITLYLDNANDLSQAYAYLNQHVSVYEWSGTAWEGTATATDLLTIENGKVSFDLASGKTYSVSVDSGNYFCKSTTTAANLAPAYYMDARF